MRDRDLYATILGVHAPWTVERVELDVTGGAVHVWLARAADVAVQCPECETACSIYDHREREWRHLDTCQLQTRLHARVPRVECPTHGVVQTAVPWATPGSKFTLLFERPVRPAWWHPSHSASPPAVVRSAPPAAGSPSRVGSIAAA
jgi:transposase